MKEKTNKVWSMDKTLVRMEESARAVILRDSVNKVFWKTGQNSQKIPVLESLFKFQAVRPAIFLKVTPAKLFSCEFCEVFKKIYFVEYPRTAASE